MSLGRKTALVGRVTLSFLHHLTLLWPSLDVKLRMNDNVDLSAVMTKRILLDDLKSSNDSSSRPEESDRIRHR